MTYEGALMTEKEMLNSFLEFVEKITGHYGKIKGHFELQNTEMAHERERNSDMRRKVEELCELAKQNQEKLQEIDKQQDVVVDKDTNLRKFFAWAIAIVAIIQGAAVGVIWFLMQLSKEAVK